MNYKIGRNDPCHCGSNLKYKRCCLEKDLQHTKLRVYGAIDPVARFLELNFRDSFNVIRYNFYLEYSKIYSIWADDPIHSQDVFDTDKCEQLGVISENQLSEIISRYPRRFWIDALRGMSLFASYMALGVLSQNDFFEYIIISTLSIHKFSSLEPPKKIGSLLEIEDILSPYNINYVAKNFAIDLGKLLGEVHALIHAQRCYRFAGKGGKLLQPPKASIGEFPSFEHFPKDSIFIVPGLAFEENEPLRESIALYEDRRDEQHEVGVTGFYQKQTNIHLTKANWWNVGTLGEFPKFTQVTVSYPNLSMSIVSQGYIIHPVEISDKIELLFPFADNFVLCFGFDFGSFRTMCHALANFIYLETSFSELRVSESSMENLVFTSKLSRNSPKARTAPLHLYNLFARAIFKAPRRDFLGTLSDGLSAEKQEALNIAERFIDNFTYHPTKLLFHDLTPWLFYPVDQEVLALDFLVVNRFMELCLRTVTNLQGETSNTRGRIFEEQARDFLIKKMKIETANIPLQPGTKLKDKDEQIDYGDVDFVFIWKNMLINLDMKSWQKNPEYLRGDFLAVDNRQKELQNQISGKTSSLERRGKRLLKILRDSGKANDLLGVLSFLCVPHVEFLSKKYNELWYGNTPRVLTPLELATTLQDDDSLKKLTEFLIE